MPMRCENGGPIADEFGAMFLLGRVLINARAMSAFVVIADVA